MEVASADAAVSGDPTARTCRSLRVTGSTLPRRTCKTQAEWERYDADFADSDASYRTDPQAGNR